MKKIKIDPNIFRTNDIRGAEESYAKSQHIVPGSLLSKSAHGAILNTETAYVIARSIADIYSPKCLVLGRDSRLSSPMLHQAMVEGLNDGGVDVDTIGICTSDLLYYAVGRYKYDLGIMITGSHTIKFLNGMKICHLTKNGVSPIYEGCGLEKIRQTALRQDFKKSQRHGLLKEVEYCPDYEKNILSLFEGFENYKKTKIIFDAANGTAGLVYRGILDSLNIESEYLNFKPDGNFPAHNPDPAVFENMQPLVVEMRKNDADFGIAWDGDADRVAIITTDGEILTGSHIGTMLLPWVASKYPLSTVIVTPPMTRAFFELAKELDIKVVYSKVGNSHVKKAMDDYNSPFGAEEADHFMFRESFGTENGILPLLIILDQITKTGKSFDQLLNEAKRGYFISGDVNIEIENGQAALDVVENKYKSTAKIIDKLDGLRVEFDDWRFCLRPSAIDPVLRLNLEAKSAEKLAIEKDNVCKIINAAV